MQIELIGPTSAGKSTLARSMLQAGQEQGIDTLMGDDFVLGQVRLGWVKGRLARTICLDLLCLLVCLVAWRRYSQLYLFAVRIISRLPASVAWAEKLNLARNVLKHIGVFEIVRRRASDQQMVLVDEGTLHAAHCLFVHVSVEPEERDLITYARLVPLPDAAIFVQQDEALLLERTLARGHKRVPGGSNDHAECFVKRAVRTFDALAQQLVVENRLLAVDGMKDPVVLQNAQNGPLPAAAWRLIGAGRDACLPGKAPGAMADPTCQGAQPASEILV